MYVHVCKIEALQEAYKMAKNKNGALKLIIEPIFEADFQEGSYEFFSLFTHVSAFFNSGTEHVPVKYA
ncbi:hypothetical protein Dtox_0513 [Desulfofarcimen acetoxidans DSM 771]|uniref:Uncharacterized protein n=1 Tax=Desulfofarcimen acetoxidans (strain ATCC 49208 / DSM 771 / KCTC 5769 / VKM B-1644 / 5575) TaxID=485916 RepID=C8W5X9_DESAS|nr:hypothetical protein Dtox_0513 [Desulfofarcimen acetoxidans DSM 771]